MFINNLLTELKFVYCNRYVFIVLLLLLALSIVIPLSCLNIDEESGVVFKYDKYLESPPDVRVLLHKNIQRAGIEIDSSYNVLDADNNNVILAQGANLPKSNIYQKSDELRIETISAQSTSGKSSCFVEAKGKIKIVPDDGGFIRLNDSKYQGNLLIFPQKNGHFSVLEELNVEDYLSGVIEGEIPTQWKDDAILAQIIAIRSYAIFQKKTKSNAQYHIDKLDLAYKGSYANQQRIKSYI